MLAAVDIIEAHFARTNSENWVEWARQHENAARLLARVESLING